MSQFTTAEMVRLGWIPETYYGRPCQYGHRRRYRSSRKCVECQRHYDRRRTNVFRNWEGQVQAMKGSHWLRVLAEIKDEQHDEALLRAYELGRRHGQEGRNAPLTLDELRTAIREETQREEAMKPAKPRNLHFLNTDPTGEAAE